MKQNIRSFLLLLLCLTSFVVTAQKKYFFNTKDPGLYSRDVILHLENSKDKQTSKSAKTFQDYWSGTVLTPKQQKMFIHLSKLLANKKFKTHPYLVDALGAVHFGQKNQNLQGAELDTVIYTMYKTVKNYDKKKSQRFISNLKIFLETRRVYSSNGYELYIQGGSFNLKYLEQSDNYREEEEEIDIDHLHSFDELDMTGEEMADDWGGVTEDKGVDNVFEEWEEEEKTEKIMSVEEEDHVSADVLGVGYIEPTSHVSVGPTIDFEDVEIVFVTKHDSTALHKTKGRLTVLDNVFFGEGGVFDWTMAGLTPEVKGTFKKYKFKIDRPHLTAEGFTLTYPSKIAEPVEGIFEFSSKKHNSMGGTDYPRFMSYGSSVEIKDLGENIRYHGGFSLRGAKVYSSSVNGGNGSIEVKHEGVLKFRSVAKHFVLSDSIISAEPSSVVIYQNNDSIYHPGVLLNFNKNQHNLHVYREKSHFKYSPFIDTYHEMDMDLDAIYWNLEDTLMHFTMVNARHMIPAFFDSKENYKLQKYVKLKGIYPFHALQMIVNYGERKRKKAFYASELADEYRQKESQIRGAMMGLMRRGYIFYNPRSGYIVLREKAFHYVESRKGKKDYDIISIKSINPGASHNATMNLKTNDLLARGVDRVNISDSLGVYFEPENREVTIKGERDLAFNGVVYTDVYVFKGRDFKMSYDTFYIDLQTIDSIQFSVLERDSITGEVIGRKKLDNQLSYGSGKLFIDEPTNKSGRKRNKQYPYFESTTTSYVYFPEALNHAYDSSVVYEVPPFRTDSMSGNSNAATTFSGTFTSGGIFPVIEEDLKAMPDYSLGFEHKVPDDGYQLYGGSGRFYGELKMDKKGLRGKGEIRYLNTTLYSDDFIFYLDSVITKGSMAKTEEGGHEAAADSATYPAVAVKNYNLKWTPRSDSMLIYNTTDLTSLYDSTSTFDGILNVTKGGMLGMGTCQIEGAAIVSEQFMFHDKDFSAHYAEFDILTDIEDKPALRSDGVKIDVDLQEGKAYFSPEEKGVASNEFPYLQYKSSLDDGIWDMKERIVTMSVPEEQEDISKSYFYSTHADQDSLVFNARKAVYSMDSLTLHVEGVPYIYVADAKVVPGNNELFIGENAQMKPIQKAEITIDTLNQYHKLFDGNITIVSRSHFEGNATYAYRNIQGDTLPIKFNNFELVEKEVSRKKVETHTVATGVVEVADSFLLGPRMMYKGKATMYSNKRLLELEGAIKLQLQGTVSSPNWLAYENKEDIDEIRIDLTKQKDNEDAKEISTGLHYSSSYRMYYGTFLGERKSQRDKTIFSTTGTLVYREEQDRFEVGSLERLSGELFEGNIFSYNEKSEEFDYDGAFDLLLKDTELREEIDLKFAGFGKNKILDTTLTLHGLCLINYDLPTAAYDMLGNDVKGMAQGLSLPSALNTENFNDSLFANIANLTNQKTAENYAKIAGKSYTPLNLASKDFTSGVLISHVDLVWNQQERVWHNDGMIGLAGIGNADINAYVKGYLEIKPSRGKNKVTLYIELDENYWYYFTFHKNQLQLLSYQQEFNDLIDSKSEMEKNQFKGEYFFMTAQSRHKKRFIKKFRTVYLHDTLMVEEEKVTENFVEETFEEENEDEESLGDILDGDESIGDIEEDVLETPVEETPVEETPVEETPVEETPVEETPVEETPVEETPVEETFDEDSDDEEAFEDEESLEDILDGDESIGDIEGDVLETPVEETPVEETPV